MSVLQNLQKAQTRDDLASILGYNAKGLSYILYKIPDADKYTSFDIPKRNVRTRLIKAPTPRLRKLQRRLANALYACLDEIEKSGAWRRSLAHGFERKRSIVTNASRHKRRRYVLNLDLEDFFPSINFGRVRGFFIKDKHFSLHQDVATVIAQIACHENELPQGSPCSPIISNLVGHVLDVRLARLARIHKCTYSRYADDITFSTNQKDFPPELAAPESTAPNQWQLGKELVGRIDGSGFKVNNKKTRMQCRGSRQVTTGLLVNQKVNIRPEYYRRARAMCNELFKCGSYYQVLHSEHTNGESADESTKDVIDELHKLEGILAHIHYVKIRTDRRMASDREDQVAFPNLYSNFLFYKNFAAPKTPLLVPEGKTDSIYLKAAIGKLASNHPKLGKVVDEEFSTTIRFLNYTRTVHEVLKLGNGSGSIASLIAQYKGKLKKFSHAPLSHPVILLIDNDDGASKVFTEAKKQGVDTISHSTMDNFYHICANLYLVKTPESGSGAKSCIEDLFDPALFETEIDGKTYDPKKEHGADNKYSKVIFAKRVVMPSINEIDFSKFGKLLSRLESVIEDHESKLADAQ